MVGGKRVENVEDVLKVGQKIQVEIAEIDPRGKLSLVPVLPDADGAEAAAATGGAAEGRAGSGRNGQDAAQQQTAEANA